MNILSSLLYFILEKIGAMPEIFISTVDPTVSDGKDGDLWIKYTSTSN